MMKLITKYIKSINAESMLNTDVYFGGRLAEYKYYDMHQVIHEALNNVKSYVTN